MAFREMVPAAIMAEVAKKVEEAAGLVAMLKPMCKRPKVLTKAEQDSFEDVVGHACQVMSDARRLIWDAKYKEEEPTLAIRKA